MGKLFNIYILALFSVFLLSGCFDAEDIEDFNIPLIAAYDVSQDIEEGVDVTALFPDVAQREREILEEVSGTTIGDTRANRGTRFPSTLLLGDIQVAMYGKDLAQKGLWPCIDNYLRDPKVKKSLFMAVVEGRGDEFLQKAHKVNPYLGFEIPGIFRAKKKNQFFATITLHDFAHQVVTTGKNPVVATIKALENGKYKIDGTAIFKKDKMIAIIGMEETVPLILLRGSEPCCGFIPFSVKKDGKEVDKGTVEVNGRRKVTVERNGDKFTFYIKLKLTGRLVEHYSKDKFILEDGYIADIEKAVGEQVKKDCTRLIDRMQNEWGVDCIDISRFALAKWRKELKDVVEEESFIQNADIKVEVEVDIPFWGTSS